MRNLYLTLCLLTLSPFFFTAHAQTFGPGAIVRPAPAGTARTILDPNGDGWVSNSNSGFTGNDDVTTSEINYKPLVPYSQEPNSDLRRGPNNGFSDFVPGIDNASYYMFYNTAQSALLFRMRMGNMIPGAKGYSILIDTDGRFGATGANADPGYIAATTGTGGNPGFEVEIVLATGGGNNGVLIYNVNDTDIPQLVATQPNWTDFSQIAIAATNDAGDPDFYLDFYVTQANLTAVGITPTTAIRVVPTTVMAPKAAIGGPKSDIYGLADNTYPDPNGQYEAFIDAQPPFTPTALGIPGTTSPTAARCAAAPTITGAVTPGSSTSVSGTWTRSSLTGAAGTATIRIYVNGVLQGQTTTVSSTGNAAVWTVTGLNIPAGASVTARAVATGESECLSSNAVVATNCNSSNTPSTTGLAITCLTDRGVGGTMVAGTQVTLYYINPTTLATTVLAGPAPNGTFFNYNGSTAWYYNSTGTNGQNTTTPCGGGPSDVNNGTYYITTNFTGSSCESTPVFSTGFNCLGLTATANPTITQTTLLPTTTTVSGTTVSNARVFLYVNGRELNTLIASGTSYSFSGLTLRTGDVVEVRAIATGSCISAAVSRTVSCTTTTPAVNLNGDNQLVAGQAITGSSVEPAGTIVRVFTSAHVLVSTTTVQSNGTWSTTNAGSTPAGFTAVAGTSYYAQAQNGSCQVSGNSVDYLAPANTSNARCGAITSPGTIANSTIEVSGTLSGSVANTRVVIYQDGAEIGRTTVSGNTWGPVNVSGMLYAGGVLTLGIREGTSGEVICPTTYSVTCSGPLQPVVTFVSCTNCTGNNPSTIRSGGTITYSVSNLTANTFYSIKESSTNRSLASGVWTGFTPPASISLTTNPLSTAGTQSAVVVATNISASGTCSIPTAPATFTVVLPVQLLEFNGRKVNSINQLNWKTTAEVNASHFEVEHSTDGVSFVKIGQVAADGRAAGYTYQHNSLARTDYYRLRMVDIDGRSKHSAIIVISEGNLSVILNEVRPNPFQDAITLSIHLAGAQTMSVDLFSAAGERVRRRVLKGSNGLNTFRITDLNGLSNGIYILRLATANDVYQFKLLKNQ